jgi:hypothetical protein
MRRLLLTGAIVFIAPGTSAQAAIACILAVVSSTVALYCQPHVDARDGQIYTLGAIVIFLSMFRSLAIKTDVSTETNSSRDAFAVILILLNIGMVIAAVVQVALVGERAIKTGQQNSIFGMLNRGRSYSTSRKLQQQHQRSFTLSTKTNQLKMIVMALIRVPVSSTHRHKLLLCSADGATAVYYRSRLMLY